MEKPGNFNRIFSKKILKKNENLWNKNGKKINPKTEILTETLFFLKKFINFVFLVRA